MALEKMVIMVDVEETTTVVAMKETVTVVAVNKNGDGGEGSSDSLQKKNKSEKIKIDPNKKTVGIEWKEETGKWEEEEI